MRTGVVAKKIGMSRYYTPEGLDVPVTLLQVEECQVVAIKTKANLLQIKLSHPCPLRNDNGGHLHPDQEEDGNI